MKQSRTTHTAAPHVPPPRPIQIRVTDRESIEAGIIVRSSYVIVSIHDPDLARANIRRQTGLRDVLCLSFHDAEPSDQTPLPPDIQPMTAKHARRIWDFCGRHRDTVGAIVVHCEMGMSRSPAVAAALSRHFLGDDARFWRHYTPNRYVFDLVWRHRPVTRASRPCQLQAPNENRGNHAPSTPLPPSTGETPVLRPKPQPEGGAR